MRGNFYAVLPHEGVYIRVDADDVHAIPLRIAVLLIGGLVHFYRLRLLVTYQLAESRSQACYTGR